MLHYIQRTLQSIALATTMMVGCTVGEAPQLIPPPDWSFLDASYEPDAGPPPPVVELTDCDGTLVDLLRNDDNCGECGIECPDETSCYEEECRTPSYLDTPCGEEGWCPEEIMRCESFHSGNYCIVPEDWGCEFDDKCPDEEICIAAYCTPIREEVCDGIDNDRNGEIDEDLAPRRCYTGPEGTAGVGICRSGLELCIDGAWTACAGERHPVVEEHILLCDGRDNDCDGCPDNNYDPVTGECEDAEPQEYDIIVIMDVSGSMGGVINAAIAASMDFAQAFDGDPNFQFSLLSHPYAQSAPISVALETGLTDYAIYRAALSRLSTSLPGVTAVEQNYSIPHMVATGAYSIGFRPTARRVYINFTDERGQSNPFVGFPVVDETLMCSAFRSDDVVAFMTHPYLAGDFDDCSIIFVLRNDPMGMSLELRSLFEEVCNQ